jgi:hypothetical protein
MAIREMGDDKRTPFALRLTATSLLTADQRRLSLHDETAGTPHEDGDPLRFEETRQPGLVHGGRQERG